MLSRNLEIRGSTLFWQHSLQAWPCSDLELGPSMLGSLDGNASRSEIGRGSSHNPKELFPASSKQCCLPPPYSRYSRPEMAAANDSIWGCFVEQMQFTICA